MVRRPSGQIEEENHTRTDNNNSSQVCALCTEYVWMRHLTHHFGHTKIPDIFTIRIVHAQETEDVLVFGMERLQNCLQKVKCYFSDPMFHDDYSIIWNERPFRYASLYFCCAIEQNDNELLTLEIIHRYVELLDKYFGSVSTRRVSKHRQHSSLFHVFCMHSRYANWILYSTLRRPTSYWMNYWLVAKCRRHLRKMY